MPSVSPMTSAASQRARSEARALEDDKTNRQNREQVRYVTLQAKTLFDSAVVCIPSPIADKLRGID